MSASLPEFIYHPDPVGTGSIVPSDTVCRSCELVRGFIYTGPVYAEDDLDDCICPWCIADGAAHRKFGACFTDEAGIGDYGRWDKIPREVRQTVAFETPGFSGWQPERWWTHCGDAARFLGKMGREELEKIGEQAVSAIAEETGYEGEELDDYMQGLRKNGSPMAYLFQCRHCKAYGGYSDCD